MIRKTLQIIISVFFLFTSSQVHSGSVEWEYTQKAKIIKYLIDTVVWPEGSLPPDTINVCVLGKLPSPKLIKDINGSIVNKRKINIRQITNLEKTSDRCQIIYISNSEKEQSKNAINSFANKPVLLLGDMDNFAISGGSMNFIVTKAFIAITVNFEALKKSKLTFDIDKYNQVTVIPTPEELLEK